VGKPDDGRRPDYQVTSLVASLLMLVPDCGSGAGLGNSSCRRVVVYRHSLSSAAPPRKFNEIRPRIFIAMRSHSNAGVRADAGLGTGLE
jgi:hypothetical protein